MRLVIKSMNVRVCWFSDNLNAMCILEVSSRKPNLQAEALRVFHSLFDTRFVWNVHVVVFLEKKKAVLIISAESLIQMTGS